MHHVDPVQLQGLRIDPPGIDVDGVAVVDADLERNVDILRQHIEVVEACLVGNALDFSQVLVDLGLDGLKVVEREGAVLRLDRQFADALQAAAHFTQRAFDGLRQRNAVVGVARRLVLPTELGGEMAGDRFAGGVVRRVVDAQAGRQAFHGDTLRGFRFAQVGTRP